MACATSDIESVVSVTAAGSGAARTRVSSSAFMDHRKSVPVVRESREINERNRVFDQAVRSIVTSRWRQVNWRAGKGLDFREIRERNVPCGARMVRARTSRRVPVRDFGGLEAQKRG